MVKESGSIFPKPVSITQETAKKVDLIFLDDNPSLTDAWVLHGEKVEKKVKIFNDIPTFRSEIMS
ncbi:MAG: hypothetical protein H0T84_14795 [Tatlockia sp.]|nr:hypothetical protein [Tatlockia sp.]